jgi:hypothetical protein
MRRKYWITLGLLLASAGEAGAQQFRGPEDLKVFGVTGSMSCQKMAERLRQEPLGTCRIRRAFTTLHSYGARTYDSDSGCDSPVEKDRDAYAVEFECTVIYDSHPQNGLADGGLTFRAEFFVFDGSEHLKRLRFAERGDMAAETFLEMLVQRFGRHSRVEDSRGDVRRGAVYVWDCSKDQKGRCQLQAHSDGQQYEVSFENEFLASEAARVMAARREQVQRGKDKDIKRRF